MEQALARPENSLQQAIAHCLQAQSIRLVVLDDDPTGIQTVHGCLLITHWDPSTLREAFRHSAPFFYLLTNTRALTRAQAAEVTRSAMEAVLAANREFSYRLVFISRSDSTLRGHFPLETDVMKQVLAEHRQAVFPIDCFVPAFLEAGRYTLDGIHYLKNGEELVPVAQTEFARDNVFAYHHSKLHDYLAEKLGRTDFEYVSLDKSFQELTPDGRDAFGRELLARAAQAANGFYLTVDTRDYADLRRFALALLHWTAGRDEAVVIRSSSSLPKALSGIADVGLLGKEQILGTSSANTDGACQKPKGLFIVGSHVRKTTEQLECLLACPGTEGIEVSVGDVLERPDDYRPAVLERIAKAAAAGRLPVVYTSRQEIRLDNADARQRLGQDVSDFLVSLVPRLPFRPAWLVAKGGITSHDILTKGLGVKKATVMGQILSGVPCLRTGADAVLPHLPYIIFPGNVGNASALKEVFEKLR